MNEREGQMKEFTEDEKTIARNINKRYKWMARDKFGTLHVYMLKPVKKESTKTWGSSCYEIARVDFLLDKGLFKSISFEDDEPTLIRDIYDPQVLDDTEREYLKVVLKPFHDEVDYVEKLEDYLIDGHTLEKEYLFIKLYDGTLIFPDFDAGKIYVGMELSKKYTLKELGITYD